MRISDWSSDVCSSDLWGGLTVEAWGGGPGLVEALWQAAARNGIEIRFSSRVLDLLYDDVAVTGVRVKGPNGVESLKAKAVVLAAGGLQANPEWRTRYDRQSDVTGTRGSVRVDLGSGRDIKKTKI